MKLNGLFGKDDGLERITIVVWLKKSILTRLGLKPQYKINTKNIYWKTRIFDHQYAYHVCVML